MKENNLRLLMILGIGTLLMCIGELLKYFGGEVLSNMLFKAGLFIIIIIGGLKFFQKLTN